jgi:translation initiation factor IF-2
MTNIDDRDTRKQGQADRPRKLELKKTVETGQVRQSFSHGRSKMVTVEVRKKRTFSPDQRPDHGRGGGRGDAAGRDMNAGLTSREREARARALSDARRAEEDRAALPPPVAASAASAPATPQTDAEAEAAAAAVTAEALPVGGGEAALSAEAPADQPATPQGTEEQPPAATPEAAGPEAPASPIAAAPAAAEVAAPAPAEPEKRQPEPATAPAAVPRKETAAKAGEATPARKGTVPLPPAAAVRLRVAEGEEEESEARGRSRGRAVRGDAKRPATTARRTESDRRTPRISIFDDPDEGGERVRSLASVRRAREKERLKQLQRTESVKIFREVVIPESLTVQELANRMAERGADVIKALLRMGVMATITQTIDGDTAELVVNDFGHTPKRVSDADVETGLRGEEDVDQDLQPRPPVVTVMGHVDHGKTSLLDALRRTDVAAHEAGGITQHIGAYQVRLASGERITFIDTPGHEAFTQMRARGAKVTDIVVLVVAADDGVKPQTVEAINHAKAAAVPMIVAVNKIDKPDADPRRVRTELLQYGIQVEDMGGETLIVDVSAKQGTNLDKLAEAILLQAEVLDLKANPRRPAEGVIVETKVERGRGAVATVLVQRGTLRTGDIFVAGQEWGRVRGLMDAAGAQVEEAGPGMPVEILGLNGTPAAGDDLIVVDSEARAREVTEFRHRRQRDARTTLARSTLEQMFNRIQQGEVKELPVVIKADVHGSAEAIVGALERMSTDQVKVQVLQSGVGGINESDVTLARASNALIIGFNVRANPQARELSRRDGVEIRYYSIIYDLTDDIRSVLSGMLAPKLRENILGYAQIRELFTISRVGKVAGCMVTEGVVKRGARLRLLRDNVVTHEGELNTLRRFKEDVREVKEGYDCGITIANFQDIQIGDMIECFEFEEVAQHL